MLAIGRRSVADIDSHIPDRAAHDPHQLALGVRPDLQMQAATFVQTIQSRTGMLVGCPEEVAFRMGYITADQLREQAQRLGKTELGSVLLDLADGEHQ